MNKTILLTGATGFLGSAILIKCLSQSHDVKVLAIVRAESNADALQRIKTACTAYFVWSTSWEARIECITGDLSKENLGLNPSIWQKLESTVDVIIHNAAIVHWIKTYETLQQTNVMSTLSLIRLCAVGKPKHMTFISSTAVLDSAKYPLDTPILESDDLMRSSKDLISGYGQTKWVSEYLLREAGKRGLSGAIVRPGYIVGNLDTGIGPTDDFLLRSLKGSAQVKCRPDLGDNTINLVPVDYCADVVVAASLAKPASKKTITEEDCGDVTVYHVTPHPQPKFNTFLSTLEQCGYTCPLVSYRTWCKALETYIVDTHSVTNEGANDNDKEGGGSGKGKEDHALLPLFEWVTNDLPADTSSKLLDDKNTQRLLLSSLGERSGGQQQVVFPAPDSESVKAYIRFMVSVGFMQPPSSSSPPYREGQLGRLLEMSQEQREALKKVGRGGAGAGTR